MGQFAYRENLKGVKDLLVSLLVLSLAYRGNLKKAKDLLVSSLVLASVHGTVRISEKSRGSKDPLVSLLVFGSSAWCISCNENRH